MNILERSSAWEGLWGGKKENSSSMIDDPPPVKSHSSLCGTNTREVTHVRMNNSAVLT